MKADAKMAQRIREISGVDTRKCMKCGKCSASCPAYNEMDIRPRISLFPMSRMEMSRR